MNFFRCSVITIGFFMLLPSTQAQEQSVALEQLHIENKRQQLQAGFASDAAACHQKFAVNSCLNGINTRQREALADLRRLEISLNDDERKKRGADQVRRIEEKLLASNSQESVDRRAQMLFAYEVRANRELEARKIREKRDQAKNQSSDSPVDAKSQKKQLSMEGRVTSDVEKADRYLDRQNQMLERRVKHDAVASKRSPSNAKPLPIPR